MDTFEKIYEVVRLVPFGMVATYGKVAKLSGVNNARLVGYALSNLQANTEIPWHRIVNRDGAISYREGGGPGLQKDLLKSEGIAFSEKDRINLKLYQW
jgi:methylated-DNA-protein-cysteine methyltransferase-like protein|tara:strand:+ start:325 stop:618 length:294 start_codon:yes stop_codon:yes gene_type:complete